jgi:hypothetical protein
MLLEVRALALLLYVAEVNCSTLPEALAFQFSVPVASAAAVIIGMKVCKFSLTLVGFSV